MRTWLYRIATNRCLDARRSASRHPVKEWSIPNVELPEPTRARRVRLTWSRYAGARFDHALTSLRAHAPSVDTTLPASTGPVRFADTDTVWAAARADGLSDLSKSTRRPRPGRRGPSPRQVAAARCTATRSPSTRPPARSPRGGVSRLAVTRPAHQDRVSTCMGSLFGLANQIVLATLALAIIGTIGWGCRAWWHRRPTLAIRRTGSSSTSRTDNSQRPGDPGHRARGPVVGTHGPEYGRN